VKISGIFFAIVIIAFLLPFMVVRCGEQDIASISGLKMATGGKVELKAMEDMTKGLADAMQIVAPEAEADGEATEAEEAETRPMKPSFLAIIALLAAIAGLVTALIMDQRSFIVPLVLAIIGFLALLLVRGGVTKQVIGSAGGELAGLITIKMQFGYYLALFSFLVAGILAFLAGRKTPLLTQEQISNVIPDKMENAFDKAKDTVTQAGTSVAGAVGGAYDKLKDKIEDADLDEKYGHAVEDANEKVEETVEKVKDTTGPEADKPE